MAFSPIRFFNLETVGVVIVVLSLLLCAYVAYMLFFSW
jgi:hypothetical protein